MKVKVLRLGHRFSRDHRMTTHVALTARAFGAEELILDSNDSRIVESIERAVKSWGGKFKVAFTEDWEDYVRSFEGEIVHLTMYGLNLNDVIESVRSSKKDKLILVGGKKVPPQAYDMADYNVAVGHQPHSEVAALAVFLDRLLLGRELEREMNGSKRIIPQERGKRMVN